MKLTAILQMIIACTLCLAVGLTGSLFTSSVSSWYQNLNKPFFNPPNWVFGPVWTALYIMMGISAFLIWQKGLNIHTVKIALLFFIIQLLLNAIWTPLFFGLKSPTLAFADIILLWFAIVVTMVKFYSISKPASFLLIPYLLWVTFASVLNFSIVLLNR
jgi:tryptophan-rich sensory protein